MKKKMLALMLLAGSSAFAGVKFNIGVGFGAPVVAAPAYGYVAPAPVMVAPGPDYYWVDGYWYYPRPGFRAWHAGYWNRRPVVRSFGHDYRGHESRERFEHGFRR